MSEREKQDSQNLDLFMKAYKNNIELLATLTIQHQQLMSEVSKLNESLSSLITFIREANIKMMNDISSLSKDVNNSNAKCESISSKTTELNNVLVKLKSDISEAVAGIKNQITTSYGLLGTIILSLLGLILTIIKLIQ